MTPDRAPVVVEASLDNLRSDDVRFLQQAAALGPLHIRVPSDGLVAALTGSAPAFPVVERLFLAESCRWVERAEIVDRPVVHDIDELATRAAVLVVREEDEDPALRAAASPRGVAYRTISAADRGGFPVPDPAPPPDDMPRVVITGCFDWLHSGHIRFFMDAAAYGALYAVVGSDRNVELLKGPGHPLQREQERQFMVGAVRSVHQCLVSSGSGWMDAEPEIAEIQPAFYVVNEDGDQPEKRDFCKAHGIELVVLQRLPHAGLQTRSSTELRGF
ncbi:MAG: adenylyltransferase/cytidyltransferase family protein [Chloroflexi bacterium]|nr:adenylyltransferase/cytidyltransferase family protein [Chloroflexota bacterium]